MFSSITQAGIFAIKMILVLLLVILFTFDSFVESLEVLDAHWDHEPRDLGAPASLPACPSVGRMAGRDAGAPRRFMEAPRYCD